MSVVVAVQDNETIGARYATELLCPPGQISMSVLVAVEDYERISPRTAIEIIFPAGPDLHERAGNPSPPPLGAR